MSENVVRRPTAAPAPANDVGHHFAQLMISTHTSTLTAPAYHGHCVHIGVHPKPDRFRSAEAASYHCTHPNGRIRSRLSRPLRTVVEAHRGYAESLHNNGANIAALHKMNCCKNQKNLMALLMAHRNSLLLSIQLHSPYLC
eukprot:6288240-Amphidinium_carterae.1